MLTAITLAAAISGMPPLQRYEAMLVDCYDGDSCTVNLLIPAVIRSQSLGLTLHTVIEVSGQKLRLCDIDTPEMRGEDKALAKAARDILLEQLRKGELQVGIVQRDPCPPDRACGKTDKYGRWLAYLFVSGKNINAWMLDEEIAQPYVIKCK